MADPRHSLGDTPRSWAGNVKIATADVDTDGLGAVAVADGSLPFAKLTAAAQAQRRSVNAGTVGTAAGAYEVLITAPYAGTIAAIKFGGKDALATDNTNFISFSGINKGLAGAGTAALLAANTGGVNTTKTTGGTALAAYALLNLAGTGATVAAGDVLALTATVSGTLANAVTQAIWQVTFSPTV